MALVMALLCATAGPNRSLLCRPPIDLQLRSSSWIVLRFFLPDAPVENNRATMNACSGCNRYMLPEDTYSWAPDPIFESWRY